jgi:hypothetical protein
VSEGSAKKLARQIAKKASRFVTVPTAELRPLPDFLIIGTQRGGTTSLYRYLCAHPQVAPAVLNKGIHYFDTAYPKGERWYRTHFPSTPYRAWMRRRAGVSKTVTGEGSPYYIFHPLGAQRIAACIPEARFILLLRDPVDRAYSHYQHEVARGFETLPFEEALEREGERLAGEEEKIRADDAYISFEHQHHSYLARGRYLDQIQRWNTFLPGDQLLVIDSADMFEDPDGTYGQVLSFLGLAPRSLPRYGKLNAHTYQDMPQGARAFLHERLDGPSRALEEYLGRPLHWSGIHP